MMAKLRMWARSAVMGYWALFAQTSAGRLLHRRDELGRERLDLGVGQRRLLRLERHGDRQGFLALRQALALIEIEQANIGNQILADAARGLEQSLGRKPRIHHEGEIARNGLERRQPQQRPGLSLGS